MNSSRNVSIAGVLSVVFLSACVSTSFTPAASFEVRNLAPVTPAEVRLFNFPPNQAFRTLGEIRAEFSGYLSDDAVIRKVRAKAATVGADAVIVGTKFSAELQGLHGDVSYTRPVSITFTAIRFTQGDASQRHP